MRLRLCGTSEVLSVPQLLVLQGVLGRGPRISVKGEQKITVPSDSAEEFPRQRICRESWESKNGWRGLFRKQRVLPKQLFIALTTPTLSSFTLSLTISFFIDQQVGEIM